MSQARIASKFELSAPGKVFLLGEYAVLADQPAVIATLGPRFRLKSSLDGGDRDAETRFVPHPQSPVGRLMDWADRMGSPPLDFEFEDPHFGHGGFGSSSAQFLLAYWAFAEQQGWSRDWVSIWKLYRELCNHAGVIPSGADLIAQYHGGVTQVNFQTLENRSLDQSFDWSQVLVFSATEQLGRKTETHRHLLEVGRRISTQGFAEQLSEPLKKGLNAIEARNAASLGAAWRDYADALNEMGLEDERTHHERRRFEQDSGVWGAKGCGANQSDALVVLLKNRGSARRSVLALAGKMDLKLVADGLAPEPGLAQEQ